MPRIFWTEEERDSVLTHAVDAYVKNSVTYLEALRLGQNLALPVHRRRPLASYPAAKPDIKLLKARYATYVTGLQHSKDKVTPTVVEPKAPEPPVAQPATLQDAPIGDLIAEIARRIASNLTAAIQREVLELEHSFKLQRHDPTYTQTGIFKKRVCVVGLLPEQEHLIEREFSNTFSLKFLGNEAARHADIPTADAYLLMKSFISHAVYGKYQKLPQHVLIDGGMSTLRMWLNTKGQDL